MLTPFRRREVAPYLRHLFRRGRLIEGTLNAVRSLVASPPARPSPRPPYLADLQGPGAAVRRADLSALGGLRRLADGPPPPEDWEIPLATRPHVLRRGAAWRLAAGDPEDLFALNRFGWALRVLEARPSVPAALSLWDLLRDWLDAHPPRADDPAWETYSACERIVHWTVLFGLLKNAGLGALPGEDRVLESLRRHGRWVWERLEYHGEGEEASTNNHLLNDGRALYVLGAVFGDPFFAEAGRRLLREESARSFTPGGFLREGSSHYHFLVWRRIQDVARVARASGDHAFVVWLDAFLPRLSAAASFFRPGPDAPLPLFGDVSPDFPPDWVVGGAGTGWGWWWTEAPAAPAATPPAAGFLDFRPDGWFRYDGPRLRVFWRAPARGGVPVYSHGHHDAGAFEAHVDGRPWLVDTGRSTYERCPVGDAGVSARGHNACLVDGHEPFVSTRLNGARCVDGDYRRSSVETRREGAATFIVRHDGFARLPGAGAYERSFRIDGGAIFIEDRFEGRGMHTVETFFHAAPDVAASLEGKDVAFRPASAPWRGRLSVEGAEGAGVDVWRGAGGPGNRPAGWFSPRYGVSMPASTARIVRRGEFPMKASYRLEVV